MRPVAPSDYDWLFAVALGTSAGSRWRLHGEMPTYDEFLSILLQGAKATCVIETADGGQRLGMVQLWHLDLLSRHAQITAFLSPEAEGKGWPLEGVLAFVDYAFSAYGLRKLYVEALEPEMRTYASLVGTVLKEEGRLRGHQYLFGTYVDGYLFAVYPEDFERFATRVFGERKHRSRSTGSDPSHAIDPS